jgi:DNA-binding LacI/PurR family transcriptional regulator
MSAKMEDVAQLAGVSTATVSRVLNSPELVSVATRQRVMDAIRQLDYRLNVAARRLRTSQTRTIAVVIPSIAEPIIHHIVEAIEDAAITAGYSLLLCSTRGDPAREQAYIDLITQQQSVDGVLYVSPRSAPQQVQRLAEGGAPLVLCNYSLAGTPGIMLDHASSIFQATRHLLELGHCRVALLNLAAPHYQPARMRRAGFERAFDEAQLRLDPALIVEIDNPTYDSADWRATIQAVLGLPDPPTGIVAFNDVVALQVYAVCRARGLRIPRDLSVTGCDDILTAQYVEPPLTSVRIPAHELGRLAMQHLLRLMTGEGEMVPLTTWLDVDLIVRESCAPPQRITS